MMREPDRDHRLGNDQRKVRGLAAFVERGELDDDGPGIIGDQQRRDNEDEIGQTAR